VYKLTEQQEKILLYLMKYSIITHSAGLSLIPENQRQKAFERFQTLPHNPLYQKACYEYNLLMPLKVYLSCTLTTAVNNGTYEQRLHIYEEIKDVLEKLNFQVFAPWYGFEPKGFKQVDLKSQIALGKYVYAKDKKEVLSSDWFVGFLDQPSLGIGMELIWAEEVNNKIFFTDDIFKTSCIVLGCKPNRIIQFTDKENLVQQFKSYLFAFLEQFFQHYIGF
jgi:hypothetical protein